MIVVIGKLKPPMPSLAELNLNLPDFLFQHLHYELLEVLMRSLLDGHDLIANVALQQPTLLGVLRTTRARANKSSVSYSSPYE